MTPSEYERVSEIDMEILHENLEVLCEEFMPDSWEVEYGVSLTFPHLVHQSDSNLSTCFPSFPPFSQYPPLAYHFYYTESMLTFSSLA